LLVDHELTDLIKKEKSLKKFFWARMEENKKSRKTALAPIAQLDITTKATSPSVTRHREKNSPILL
jgi:hypothetical protein